MPRSTELLLFTGDVGRGALVDDPKQHACEHELLNCFGDIIKRNFAMRVRVSNPTGCTRKKMAQRLALCLVGGIRPKRSLFLIKGFSHERYAVAVLEPRLIAHSYFHHSKCV